jgi:hypothetical protein
LAFYYINPKIYVENDNHLRLYLQIQQGQQLLVRLGVGVQNEALTLVLRLLQLGDDDARDDVVRNLK